MVSRQRRAAVRGALTYWLAVGCLAAACQPSDRNLEDAGSDAAEVEDAGSDAALQCIVDAGAPSEIQYCSGICYAEYCCTDAHPDCPAHMPAEGTCCSPRGIGCAYRCAEGEWDYLECSEIGAWVKYQVHCNPPPPDGGW
jgi:hypothetical protein